MRRLIILVAGAVCLSGCATVTRGTKDSWVVETEPAGAQVSTTNGFKCDSTPCAIKMPRKSAFTATISKDGFETVNVEVTNKVAGSGSAAMAGNLLAGGLIGAGVDAGSGAMLDLTPNPVKVTLAPKVAAAAPAEVVPTSAADVPQ